MTKIINGVERGGLILSEVDFLKKKAKTLKKR